MASSPGARGSGELTVGVVTGPHGVRGALKIHLHEPGGAPLLPGLAVAFVDPQVGTRTLAVIVRISPVPGKPLVRVFTKEITAREQAESLRGQELRVDRTALPPLAEDEFYLADMLGHVVIGRVGPGPERELGKVVGLTTNGEQDLLEVSIEGRPPWLLPVLPQFIREVDGSTVRVDLPRGMGPEDAR